MQTRIWKTDNIRPAQKTLKKAALLLKQGQVVAFPTETVYGLGALALNKEAVNGIFKAKNRPPDNPLIVHISHIGQINDIAFAGEIVFLLAKHFWPGPLTLVLPKKENVPANVTAGLNTVALRMPANNLALKLINEVGSPLAAPSANASGRPSPTYAHHVFADLNGKIPLILDGGAVNIGLESTVLNLSSPMPQILRPGRITPEDLYPLLGEVKTVIGDACRPPSPGMKYTHYSPEAKVILSPAENLNFCLEKYGKHSTLTICWEESAALLPKDAARLIIGKKGDCEAYARNLFAFLRRGDELGAEYIIAEESDEKGLGAAIMNRLRKAAGEPA
jgi:L-threonylcarbamoyladenylate synthase